VIKRIFQTAALVALLGSVSSYAGSTHRTPQFENDKVNVWKTVIYPSTSQSLQMHRHDNNRVLVAFDNGTLKITTDKGVVHYLKLEKNKAYYLTKETPGELHSDENISKHPIEVMVIELKD
jgi:hypothetical protein